MSLGGLPVDFGVAKSMWPARSLRTQRQTALLLRAWWAWSNCSCWRILHGGKPFLTMARISTRCVSLLCAVRAKSKEIPRQNKPKSKKVQMIAASIAVPPKMRCLRGRSVRCLTSFSSETGPDDGRSSPHCHTQVAT